MDYEIEQQLRAEIMLRLTNMTDNNGGFVYRRELLDFQIQGEKFPLIDISRGIRNPKDFSSTLSIFSSSSGPYKDVFTDDGLLEYSYQTGSLERDNTKFKLAVEQQVPVILFRKEIPNIYIPIFPVFLIEDLPSRKIVRVALDQELATLHTSAVISPIERKYAQRIVKQRLHQKEFRGSVLRAYKTQCAVCSLRHGVLLDAAHIIDDKDELGIAHVTNGISLCKIHHASFDKQLLGVSPNYTIEIKTEILSEIDGPMLRHGLQEMHGKQLILPNSPKEHPSKTALALKYEKFLNA